MKDLKIEAGKFYKLRDGRKVEIYSTDNPGIFPIHGRIVVDRKNLELNSNLITFNSEGRFSHNHGGLPIESFEDIVEEWVEPLSFYWEGLPAWANKYIAMDSNGLWYCYNKKPILCEAFWDSTDDAVNCVEIPVEHAPKNFTGSWKESLFKDHRYR